MSTTDSETLKAAVRETYGRIASGRTPAGCCSGSRCCGPASIRDDLEAYGGGVAGAGLVPDVVRMLNEAGFKDVVVDVQHSRECVQNTEHDLQAEDFIASALIDATKPSADQSRG